MNQIITEADYKKALKRAMKIFLADNNSSEINELTLLLKLITDFEDENIKMPKTNPVK